MASFFDKFKKKPFHERKAVVEPKKESKPTERSVGEAKRGTPATGNAHRVLVRPIISEKSTRLVQARTYVFEVARSATKDQVARAVTAVYGIAPQRVNMAVISGHRVRFGKVSGKMRDWKKAIVTLPSGAKIDLTAKD